MNYMWKFLSNFKEFYNEINSATLTGAIDVVVVQQEDGTYMCSPFHVRFGKIGVLRSREKVVDIEVNGEPVDIRMKLGESGEAFFVEEIDDLDLVPNYLATSPLPTYPDMGDEIAKLKAEEGHSDRPPSDDTGPPDMRSTLEETVEVTPERTVIERTSVDEIRGDRVESKTTAFTRILIVHQNVPSGACGSEIAIENSKDDAAIPNHDNVPVTTSQDVSVNVARTFTPEQFDPEKTNNATDSSFQPIPDSPPKNDTFNFDGKSGSRDASDEDNKASVVPGKASSQPVPTPSGLTAQGRKKRKRRSMHQRRKGGNKGASSNALKESDATDSGFKGSGSSEDQPEEIFQMDVDEKGSSSSGDDSRSSPAQHHQSYGPVNVATSAGMTRATSAPPRDRSSSLPIECKDSQSHHTEVVSLSPLDICVLDPTWQYKTLKVPLDCHPFSDTDITPMTSPVTSRPSTPKSDTEYEAQCSETTNRSEMDRDRWSWTWGQLPVPPQNSGQSPRDNQDLERSSSGAGGERENGKRPHEPTSDDEDETRSTSAKQSKKEEEEEQRSMLGGMFRFMRRTKKERHDIEGIYLDDLNSDDLDPEIAALYFTKQPNNKKETHGKEETVRTKDDDAESGNGSSLPQSPHSVAGAIGGSGGIDSDSEDTRHAIFDFKGYNDVSFSLCGGLNDSDPDIPQDKFLSSVVTYDTFCNNPNLLSNPDLVIRLNGRYYNWPTASPIIMSLILFQKPLTESVIGSLVKEHMPKKQKKQESRGLSWFVWRRSNTTEIEPKKGALTDEKKDDEIQKPEHPTTPLDAQPKDSTPPTTPTEMAPNSTQSEETSDPPSEITRTDDTNNNDTTDNAKPVRPKELISISAPASVSVSPTESPVSSAPGSPKKMANGSVKSSEGRLGDSDHEGNFRSQREPIRKVRSLSPVGGERFRKSLRLTSDQIAKLNLQEGANEVVFSVTTAYQGTTRCKCHIYLWRHDDQIVISDIDGTITKSDVLGHILPIIGRSWAQSGVAQLFTKIKENGYQFLYLSARAIGQARITREYLRSVRQGDVCLPDGPLLLSPSSLISALHREVIERKPEVFKISCLRDIQALFPNRNPFYAGYGNRINDVWAYRSIGIPMSRIFTINHRGELKHELTQTFQSSYDGLSYVVDHIFPPLQRTFQSNGRLVSNFQEAEQYSSFTYWRDPIPDLELDDIEKIRSEEMMNPQAATIVIARTSITTSEIVLSNGKAAKLDDASKK